MFSRKRKPSDFAAEIQAHLELEAEQLKEQGLSEEEARMAARRAFGNVTRAEERFYESGRWLWWDHLAQDLRFGLRMLARNPGFTAVAVLTLALSIGANTALFSVVNGVLLKPLPYWQPDRLVALYEGDANFTRSSISYPNFLDWVRDNRSFSSLSAYRADEFNLTGMGEAERVPAEMISASFFQLLGVKPVIGRAFRAEEDQVGAAPGVLISQGLWKRKFGSSASPPMTRSASPGLPAC